MQSDWLSPRTVLWVYIVLLVAGGLMGYLKAQSKMSLMTSLFFAAGLVVCQLGLVKYPYAPDILVLVLLIFFGWRFINTKKFMPMGLMSILSVVVLALRNFH